MYLARVVVFLNRNICKNCTLSPCANLLQDYGGECQIESGHQVFPETCSEDCKKNSMLSIRSSTSKGFVI